MNSDAETLRQLIALNDQLRRIEQQNAALQKEQMALIVQIAELVESEEFACGTYALDGKIYQVRRGTVRLIEVKPL